MRRIVLSVFAALLFSIPAGAQQASIPVLVHNTTPNTMDNPATQIASLYACLDKDSKNVSHAKSVAELFAEAVPDSGQYTLSKVYQVMGYSQQGTCSAFTFYYLKKK